MPNNQEKKDLRSDLEKQKRKLAARMREFQEQKKRALEKRGRRPKTKEQEEERKPSEGKEGLSKQEQAGGGKNEKEKRRGKEAGITPASFGVSFRQPSSDAGTHRRAYDRTGCGSHIALAFSF